MASISHPSSASELNISSGDTYIDRQAASHTLAKQSSNIVTPFPRSTTDGTNGYKNDKLNSSSMASLSHPSSASEPNISSGDTNADRPAASHTLTKETSNIATPFPKGTTNGTNGTNIRKDDAPDSADRLIHELSAHQTHTLPLWAQMTKLNPPEPNPQCTPYVWRYQDVRPYLIRAGELITEKQAERRVLMLVNPARNEAPYTTDTIYGGLQLVMPNETAPAHRHVAFAMRFIVEGEGGFTAVHGKRVTMKRGDVILTPVWNWHDHGNGGDKPMIWLDALDLPLFRHFPVHFVEHFSQPRYPAEDIDSNTSPIVFPWHKMKAKLDASSNGGKEWCRERYLRGDGSEVSLTLGSASELIPPHSSSPVTREVASSIYHVISGAGHSTIGGHKVTWTTGDTFCVPTWMEYSHSNEGEGVAYLYRADDVPMMRGLGFYRRGGETGEEEGRYFR